MKEEVKKNTSSDSNGKRADRIFLLVLIASFVLHNVILIYLYHVKIPRYESLPEIQRFVSKRFLKIIAPKLTEEKKEKGSKLAKGASIEEKKGEKEKGKEEGKPGPEKTKEEGTAGKGTSISKEERIAEMRKKVRTKGILAIITSKRSSGGALATILKGTASFGQDLDKVMRTVTGVKMARSSAELKIKRAGGTGGGGVGIGEIKATEGGAVGLGGKEKAKVASNIRTTAPDVQGYLDANAIRNVVMRRMGLIKYCYEKELKKNPNLSGKVVVRFTINAEGRVVKTSIESSTLNNEEVESCILMIFRRMVFPKPKEGGNVNVSYPIVFTIAS